MIPDENVIMNCKLREPELQLFGKDGMLLSIADPLDKVNFIQQTGNLVNLITILDTISASTMKINPYHIMNDSDEKENNECSLKPENNIASYTI